ncbi:hypothetical protein BH10ACI1_BH10ACI1_08380 [soil metagenome]
MLKTNKKLLLTVIFAILMLGGATFVSAQNIGNTVIEKEIKFARGENTASLDGNAKYQMSYVYKLTAKEGQTMDINLTGNNSELTFSLIAPDEETMKDGFGVKEWSGKLPQSGEYSIVVVMNDDTAKSGVPFTLDVEIN